ncbi:MAG: hypothetical protein WC325_12245 [Candidatus Bathyarchaeia archaeon]
MSEKKLLGTIFVVYGAISVIVTLATIFGAVFNATALTILNPLQTVIANFIQASTGFSLARVGYVGWGLFWMFIGWAMYLWGKGEKQ